MKKNLILLIVFSFTVFSCKSNKNSDKEEIENNNIEISVNNEDVAESLDSSIFIQFDGNPEFNDFLSFFEKIIPPFYYRPTPFVENVFPEKFNKFVDFIKDEELYMIPQIQFTVHEKYIGVYFVVTDLEENLTSYLYIYDKIGNIISSKEIYYFDIGEEFSTLNVDQYFNIFELDKFFGRFQEWSYQGDGTAYMMRGHSDYVTTVTAMSEIDSNGKISEDIPYLSVVNEFLEDLDNEKYEDAYELQKNPNWGDFEQFSSTNAFGGISEVYVDSLDIFIKYPSQAIITCSAKYIDTVNGSSRIIQNFTVSRLANRWEITDMKVDEFKREEYYKSEDFQDSDLKLYNITKEGFNFTLLVVSEFPEDNYEEKYAGEISGYAKFESENFAFFQEKEAILDFDFSNIKNDVKITEENCGNYRHEDISFDGNFHISKYRD